MLNGDGLRVVLWVSGCSHGCKDCQNPVTWDPEAGLPVDQQAKEELFAELSKDYISGITYSGGDPLFKANRQEIAVLIREIHEKFPRKTQWLYTGYLWEEIQDLDAIELLDVVVDGPFLIEQKDNQLFWRGSPNQRVMDVRKSKETGSVVLWVE